MPKLSALDLFRKVPTDLTQATRRGGVLSIIVASLIGVVLFLEIWTYAAGETRSRIVLDSNREAKLDLNFQLSFLELPCRFATVELWDYLGNSKLDVSASIKKTVITGEMGQTKKEQFIDPRAPVTEHVAPNPPDVPHGVMKVSTSEYGPLLKANEYTFVLYYVDVCFFAPLHGIFFMRIVLTCKLLLFCSGACIAKWPCPCGLNSQRRLVRHGRMCESFKWIASQKNRSVERQRFQATRPS